MAPAAIVVMMGWLSLAAPAVAEPTTRVRVEVTGCEGLAQAEVARLLDLELSMVTSEIRKGPPLEVELRCVGERLTITVVDPLTRKRLARDVPAPAAEPGRERVVALAVSQLFAASWLELLAAAPPPPPPPDDTAPAPDDTAIEAARRVAERSTELAPPIAARRSLELLVGAGARGRALESDGRLAAARTELLLRGELRPHLGWLVLAGWDLGQDTRRQGQVRGHAITAGGGLAWSARPGAVGVGGHVVVAGGYGRVRGVSREPGVPDRALAAPTAEASASLGPRIRYGRLRFDIDAEVGAMLRAPLGIIDGGAEPPMTMGGLWGGVMLRIGGALR